LGGKNESNLVRIPPNPLRYQCFLVGPENKKVRK